MLSSPTWCLIDYKAYAIIGANFCKTSVGARLPLPFLPSLIFAPFLPFSLPLFSSSFILTPTPAMATGSGETHTLPSESGRCPVAKQHFLVHFVLKSDFDESNFSACSRSNYHEMTYYTTL